MQPGKNGFHVNRETQEVGPCNATIKSCKVGGAGDHFADMESAAGHLEGILNEEYGHNALEPDAQEEARRQARALAKRRNTEKLARAESTSGNGIENNSQDTNQSSKSLENLSQEKLDNMGYSQKRQVVLDAAREGRATLAHAGPSTNGVAMIYIDDYVVGQASAYGHYITTFDHRPGAVNGDEMFAPRAKLHPLPEYLK